MAAHSRSDFKRWGRQGGRARARLLPQSRRLAIAAHAARSRWAIDASSSSSMMPSVRLSNPDWEDPVYLEEILSEGGLKEWKELYQRTQEHPFGPTATALDQLLHSVQIYGVVPLWRSLLKNLRGENQ